MTASTKLTPEGESITPPKAKPDLDGKQGIGVIIGVYVLAIGTLVALLGLIGYSVIAHSSIHMSKLTFGLFLGFYFVRAMGITGGFHRLFTHSSYVAARWLKITLAICGQLALQGPLLVWTADHRRHHKYADHAGDPHSPTYHEPADPATFSPFRRVFNRMMLPAVSVFRKLNRKSSGDVDSPFQYGDDFLGLFLGLGHAQMGWLLHRREMSYIDRWVPELKKDKDLRFISDRFFYCLLLSLGLPALIDGLLSWSWRGVFEGLFWVSLVGVAILLHVTWAINSICHVVGDRPFKTRDSSTNFWPLALLSLGESWHNLHHSDPSCARHGVLRGQIDITARTIWIFEKMGAAAKVKWPTPERINRIKKGAPQLDAHSY